MADQIVLAVVTVETGSLIVAGTATELQKSNSENHELVEALRALCAHERNVVTVQMHCGACIVYRIQWHWRNIY
jgi:hypothetical protein